MRILCARYVHLGLLTALRRFPELRGEPVVIGGAPGLRLPVIAASSAALSSGVRPGMPLRQAQQLCPAAAFVPLDPTAATRLRDELGAALHRVAPTVETSDDEAFCDLTGRHAAFDDERAWGVAVARAVAAVCDAEPPAVGIGGTRFVAHLAARLSRPGHIRRVRHGDEASFLAPLPLDVLPVDPRIAARLAGFGLDCLGAVAGLSPAELQRQFGRDGLELHRLVLGADGDGVHAPSMSQTWSERLVLDPPVAELETLLQAARRCAASLGERLTARCLAAGEVRLAYEVEAADEVAVAAVTAAPAGNTAETWTVVLSLLGELHPPAPVTAVRVELTRLSPAAGRQTDLLRPGDAVRDSVVDAATRLTARFGAGVARRPRLAVDPGDLPERRFVWELPLAAAASRR